MLLSLSGCSNVKDPSNTDLAFTNQSIIHNLKSPLTKPQLHTAQLQILKSQPFKTQFQTLYDPNQPNTAHFNPNDLTLPHKLKHDVTMIQDIIILQLNQKLMSKNDLLKILKTKNHVNDHDANMALNRLSKRLPNFSFTNVAKLMIADQFKTTNQVKSPIIQNVYHTLKTDDYSNNQTNVILNLLNQYNTNHSDVNQKLLNQRVSKTNSTNQTLVKEFVKANLTTPQSKVELYQQLINQNGFNKSAIDKSLKTMSIDFNLQALLVAINTQNNRPRNQKDNAIQLANAVLTKHFSLQTAKWAANHVPNTSKQQKQLQQSLNAIDKRQAQQAKRFTTTKPKPKTKHLKHQQKLDQLAWQKLMQPYRKKYEAALQSTSEFNAFKNQTYPLTTDYQKALIITRGMVSSIYNSQSLSPKVALKNLTNPHQYYHFKITIAKKALQQALSDYQLTYNDLAINYAKQNHFNKAMAKTMLPKQGFTASQTKNAIKQL